MEWPEKKYVLTGNCTNEDYAQGYNAAIEACKAAYAKETRLVALDEESLSEIQDCISHYVDDDMDIGKIMRLIRKFGFQAIPTVESIHEVIKEFLLEYKITMHIGECQAAGAGKLLGEAIHRRLVESKTFVQQTEKG